MADLPFLRNKNKYAGGGGPIEMEREPDGDTDLSDHIVDEFLEAIETKNKALLKDALKALVFHIQDEDAKQDAGDVS